VQNVPVYFIMYAHYATTTESYSFVLRVEINRHKKVTRENRNKTNLPRDYPHPRHRTNYPLLRGLA